VDLVSYGITLKKKKKKKSRTREKKKTKEKGKEECLKWSSAVQNKRREFPYLWV